MTRYLRLVQAELKALLLTSAIGKSKRNIGPTSARMSQGSDTGLVANTWNRTH